LPQTGVGKPHSKLASQIAAKEDGLYNCIDSLWELASSLPNGTIIDPQNSGNQKIKLNTAAKTKQTPKGFVMRSV